MTSYAPFDIIFGFSPYRPLHVSFDSALPKDYIDYMIKRTAIIRKNAQIIQEKYDELRKRHYDKKRADNELTVGDLVLYNIGVRYIGNDKKFKPNYIGPFEIIKIFNDG
eukprot:67951_1